MKNLAAAVAVPVGAVLTLGIAPLFAFAACQASQTPITVPVALTGNVDGFGPLNTTSIPNQAWVPWLERAGALCPQIPASLLAAQIEQESSWNPNAQSATIAGLQTGGAQGLSQFMPATWAQIGRNDAGDGNISPFNPIDAIMAQGRYMCQLAASIQSDPALTRGDVVALALAAYNAGLDAVQKYGGIPPYQETQAYVPSIAQLATTKYSIAGTTAGTPAGGAPVPVGRGRPPPRRDPVRGRSPDRIALRLRRRLPHRTRRHRPHRWPRTRVRLLRPGQIRRLPRHRRQS